MKSCGHLAAATTLLFVLPRKSLVKIRGHVRSVEHWEVPGYSGVRADQSLPGPSFVLVLVLVRSRKSSMRL